MAVEKGDVNMVRLLLTSNKIDINKACILYNQNL